MSTDTRPLLAFQRTEECLTETVRRWKYDIGRLYYWVADDIVEDFAAEYLATPDEILRCQNNVVRLQMLAEHSASHVAKARRFIALVQKHSAYTFWPQAGIPLGQEGMAVF